MEVLNKVTELLAQKAGVPTEEVKPETKIQDELDLDSLDIIELILEMEREFSIFIPDEDSENVVTVADVVALVESKIVK